MAVTYNRLHKFLYGTEEFIVAPPSITLSHVPGPPTGIFRFDKLPPELRLEIWKHAIPKLLKTIGLKDGIIKVHRNLDWENGYGLLPSVKDLRMIFGHCDCVPRTDHWKSHRDRAMRFQRSILNLLWACCDSRRATMKVYALDCGSIISSERILWKPDDKVFIPGSVEDNYYLAQWLSMVRSGSISRLRDVKVLYLRLTHYNIAALNASTFSQLLGICFDFDWMVNFPNLATLRLIWFGVSGAIDRMPQLDEKGDIQLEPLPGSSRIWINGPTGDSIVQRVNDGFVAQNAIPPIIEIWQKCIQSPG